MAMMILGMSLWAVIAALVASNVLGMAWFSMSAFGKSWVKLIGKKPESKAQMKKAMPRAMAINVVTTLVTIYVLSVIVQLVGASTWLEGANIGFWVWLGFVATVKMGDVIWAMRPFKLWLIEAGFQLVNLAVMGAILATL